MSALPGVLIVGNFLSHAVQTRGVCEDLADRLDEAGLSVVTTSDRRSRVARLCDMLRTVSARREDYSVAQVDVFSGAGFLWAEAVTRRLRSLGKPFVLSLHGGELPRFGRRWPRRVSRLFRSAAAITSPSRYLIEELVGFRSDIVLLPNPIDVGRYPFVPRRAPRPRLIWLRAFHDIYNPLLAVRAFALVLEERGDARLEMIGPDKGDGSLQQVRREIRERGLGDRVRVVEGVPKSEVPARLSEADLFLNTSRVDNAPVSVVEPMACGLCVVSTEVGGISYLLSNGEDSLLVPSDDDSAMASAILRLLSEEGLAAKLSTAGRRRAEENDWSRLLPRWIDLLSRAAERR